jgi:hypothetical protein
VVSHYDGRNMFGAFENRVFRRIFGCKRDEGTGKILCNKEFYYLFSSCSVVRLIK